MKLYVDLSGKQVTVSKEPAEKRDENGRQKSERATGRLMWTTQVFVLDEDGGEVITVTTVGERPNVKVGAAVVVDKLEVLPWSQTRDGQHRSGVAYRAAELKAASAVKAA
ncbi:MAG TPA: hypothetical protein VGP02_00080 [Mycobacteriales bacterium]|nr:hypothetical protein [Mycobacteriales bacterium]